MGLRVKFVALLGTPKRFLYEACESHVLRYAKVALFFCFKLLCSPLGSQLNLIKSPLLMLFATVDHGEKRSPQNWVIYVLLELAWGNLNGGSSFQQ
jgi:hypothetical protein